MASKDSLLERRRRRTAWLAHEACARHEMGERHPERPARLHAIAEEFVNTGLAGMLHRMPAPLATEEELGARAPAGLRRRRSSMRGRRKAICRSTRTLRSTRTRSKRHSAPRARSSRRPTP